MYHSLTPNGRCHNEAVRATAAPPMGADAAIPAPGAAARHTVAFEAGWILRTLLPPLACVALTLVAYGNSLQAGIMFDAALDLPRATERSWLEVLTSAGASPYFRPVTLLIWKASYELLGRNDFVVLHALSLASHAMCGWLVYQLGRRLLGWQAGLAAAALFLWFPLSYQVVDFVDSIFHSLAALWLLAAAVLFWDARRFRSRGRLTVALASGALALLTHESTVALLAPAMVVLDVILRSRSDEGPCTPGTRSWQRVRSFAALRLTAARWPAIFVAETVAFVGVWLAVPRWPSTPKVDVPSIQLNGAYFLQALAYPVTMHLPWLGNEVAEVLLISVGVLLVLVGLAAIGRRLAVAGFGLLWFGLALLPSWLLLPWPNYVIDAPRLLYVASAGIALLWAAALSRWRIVGGLVIVAILLESYSFVAERQRLLDLGAGVVRQVVDTAAQALPDAGRVYVNVPAFVGPKDSDFLLGHSGVTMLPDYFGLDLEVAAATGVRAPIASFAFDDLAAAWQEAYGFQGQRASAAEAAAAVRQGGGVYVTRYEPNRLRLEYVGRVEARASAGVAVARFGDWAAVESGMARVEDGSLRLSLVWRALAAAPADYTVFVHVVGAGPQPVVQSDGYPIAGMLPPRDWQAGTVVHDERSIPLPASAAGQPLRVLVGLYDRAAPTTRAAATGADGARLADDALEIRPSEG